MRVLWLIFALASSMTAQPKLLNPAGAARPVGPYSPALDTGAYVYVSGQGVRDGAGAMPAGIEAQTRQCLANVRANLQAAGLDFHHIAAVQIYLADLANLPTVERIWFELLGDARPPRLTLGVTRMPTGTTVEITVVARRNPGDRLYLDAVYGQTRQDTQKKFKAALKKARLAPKHISIATWYTTTPPTPGVITVAALPDNAQWAVSAIAAKPREPSAVFCEIVASSGSGAVEQQTGEAFTKLKACLAKRGATLAQVVATNVYLDDLDNFAKMNAAYAANFAGLYPTRTTIQPAPSTHAAAPAVRLSAVAEKF